MWYDLLMAHKLEKGCCTLSLGARGRLVLPAEVRRLLAVKEGDRILLTVGRSGRLSLVPMASVVRSARGMLRRVAEGRNLSDELIRDRRREAAREDAEP